MVAIAAQGREIIEAADGASAWQLLETRRHEMAILDVRMEGYSGLELCRMAREHGDLRHTVLILMSGDAEEKDRAVGLEAGAVDYIVKPFSPRKLRAMVDSLLR